MQSGEFPNSLIRRVYYSLLATKSARLGGCVPLKSVAAKSTVCLNNCSNSAFNIH